MNARFLLTWQKILAQGFSTAGELLDFLQLPDHPLCQAAERSFKTRVPRCFAERMQKGNPNDPLLLQVLAVKEEMEVTQGFSNDPLDESKANPLQGLIHKYHGRVLLTLTGACAIHCRYCFRRQFPYHDNNPGRLGWKNVLEYIASDTSLYEVILSGGDPLLATDSVLASLLEELEAIPHLKILRIHTRIPIVLPERITADLIALLGQSRFLKVVVMHCNHTQELDSQVATACKQLKEAGCQLLNQSVLLKGVNDNAGVLAELSKQLFSFGIIPYYLHLLDKVQGAAHFDLPEKEALEIFRSLQTLVPGYLLPRLAREKAGELSKSLLV